MRRELRGGGETGCDTASRCGRCWWGRMELQGRFDADAVSADYSSHLLHYKLQYCVQNVTEPSCNCCCISCFLTFMFGSFCLCYSYILVKMFVFCFLNITSCIPCHQFMFIIILLLYFINFSNPILSAVFLLLFTLFAFIHSLIYS